MRKLFLSTVFAFIAAAPAAAAEIVVYCPGAVQSVVRPLVQD
ncbi:MAG: hypothetical protein WA322_04075 [Pseudolabrys sp.]